MTLAALKAKLEKDAPPPSYEQYELLTSDEFITLVEEKIELDAQKKTAEDRLKEIGPQIEAYLTSSETDKVAYRDGYTVKIGRGTSPSKLSATRLVEQGVSLEVIAAATEEGKPYTFAQIVAPKPQKEG